MIETSVATQLVLSNFQTVCYNERAMWTAWRLLSAIPPAWPLHLLKEGGVSYTEVPLASYVTHSPN